MSFRIFEIHVMQKVLRTVVAVLCACANTVFAQEYDQVHACDEYAAHPNDPNRWAKGVLDDEIIPGPAVKHCQQAYDQYPETPRFAFQLGRSLWAAYRFEEGLGYFVQLEENFEYGPVYAYLGDAFMYGIGEVDIDEELSISLYQIAEEYGFSPASEVLAELQGDQSEYTSEVNESVVNGANQAKVVQSDASTNIEVEASEPFSPRHFLDGDVMAGLYHGNFDSVRKGQSKYLKTDLANVYLSGFLAPFSQNVNFIDENNSCIDLYQPVLAKELSLKIARAAPGNEVLFGGDLDAASRQGWEMMGEMLSGLANGRGLMNNSITQENLNVGLLKSNGEKDAVRLIKRYGCESDTVKAIFANMTSFILNRSPIVSDEEKERQKKEKERNAQIAEANRQKQLRVGAQESCVAQFKKQAFCTCIVNDLENYQITDNEWTSLRGSFKQIISIGKKYDGVGTALKSCRSAGG